MSRNTQKSGLNAVGKDSKNLRRRMLSADSNGLWVYSPSCFGTRP